MTDGLTGTPNGITTCLHRVRHRSAAPAYLASLTAAGLLRRDAARLLGFIPLSTHTLVDPATCAARVSRVDATLAAPSAASPRDLSLTTLAATADLTHRLHPIRPDRPTRRLLSDLIRADRVSAAVATSIRNARTTAS